MSHQFYRTEIRGFEKFLPDRKVTNDELSTMMETSDEWIRERSGIIERRFADDNTMTSDLAIGAVKKLLQKTELTPQDFDCILGCTLSPDTYFPGIAPMVQNKMGFPHIPALDLRVQCSAFVYSMQVADSFIQSGKYKRILILYADLQSRLLDLSTKGRNMAVLFADGGGALICEAKPCSDTERPTAQNNVRGVIDTFLGSDGSGADILRLKAPGTATEKFINPAAMENGDHFPFMEGRAVFKNAVIRMSEVVETLLSRNGLKAEDVDLFIPHQANLRISDALRQKLNLPEEKVFNNIQKYGNTTSATIVICLAEALEEGRIKPGSLIVTVAFGAGFTWGGNLIRV